MHEVGYMVVIGSSPSESKPCRLLGASLHSRYHCQSRVKRTKLVAIDQIAKNTCCPPIYYIYSQEPNLETQRFLKSTKSRYPQILYHYARKIGVLTLFNDTCQQSFILQTCFWSGGIIERHSKFLGLNISHSHQKKENYKIKQEVVLSPSSTHC